MKKPSRILTGIAWFVFFLSIILLLDARFNGDKAAVNFMGSTLASTFQGINSKIDSLFHINKTDYTGPVSVTTHEIVQEESTVINAVDKVSPAVVSVVVKTTNFDFFSGNSTSTDKGIGTGFIVDKNGLIVTNSHVVDDPNGEYSVVLKDGSTYDVNKINLDESTDLAILEITARNLPTVELGNSDVLKVGQMTIAIGNALGRFENTVTVGVVSGIQRQLQATSGFGNVKTYENIIQTDAALNPGNSGGPLLNSSGQVIGINVATTMGADNISFAIPVNTLKPILDGFIKEGRIIHPYLGVTYATITPEIAQLRDLPAGAYIQSVVKGSPAEKAGLQRGDVIKSINNTAIDDKNTLSSIVGKSKVGDKINLIVDRDNKVLNLTATIDESPANLQ